MNWIVSHKVLFCTIIWISLAVFFGKSEARYFFYRNTSSEDDGYNPHLNFTLIRCLIMASIFMVIQDWKSVLALSLLFPFFHDGAYYTKRNQLDHSYPKEWFDMSTTSTSFLDKLKLTSPIVRTTCAVIGGIALVIINYTNL